ncbi:MAG TPA: DEAD/DEAH box helicase [Bryobacteraceae bacterium]|jgi:ATP-dependent Lhr-like helicase|nr:DEAD/DEAH box helicase [Bryobacteraceae bacterium]
MQLSGFDTLVQQWFAGRFESVTEPQKLGWPEIAAGHNTLISAPTGSGKTLAAFLICIDRLVRAARAHTLAAETQVIYVSPLKALTNDVHRNLEVPLAQIADLAERQGIPLMPIRAAVRTGDTPNLERTQMLKKPPHILVTTPESLFILLTAEKPREMLRNVSTLIVDEIHAIADDKRGSHLALSIARLDALTVHPPQRIGLSATVKPIEEVAQLLGNRTRVIDVGHRRDMDLAVEVPRDELGAVASTELWNDIYDRIAELILSNRTTLVFVNTRRLSERVAHALAERIGPQAVLPHHGSLSRQLRFDAESRLKQGELRAVVATASLELGIDIGTVDLVCQIGSPRSIAVALQRIGRSGHWIGAKPVGRLFPTTRDDLIECIAVISAIRKGDLEKIEIPQNAIDILAQQIVATAASESWKEDDLFAMIRSAYPYRNLPRETFDSVIEMLSEGIATSRGRSGTLLHRDQVNGRVKGRRGARLAAITSGGAIPDTANYAVVAEPDGKTIGTLDEDFAIESLVGDVFLLGTHSWRIKRVESGRVRVTDAHGAAPSIPFWLGEAPGRSRELSAEVASLRERVLAGAEPLAAYGVDETAANQITTYIQTGASELGALPTQTTVVAERFFDQSGGMQFILHAPFGSAINRAWGLALRKRFCRNFNFELQAAATDNGLVLSLSDQHSFPLELVFSFLRAATVEDVLRQALLTAPMFGSRWRWNAMRALAILRFSGGKRTPVPILRMRAEDLLASVFPDQVACAENLTGPPRIPDHPLVNETIDNCLHEAMDLDGLSEILEGIEDGRIRTIAIDTAQASPFSHEIINANPYAFLDDAPLEERRTRAVQLRQTLGSDITGGEGILDAAAIDQISAEAWPEARDADELHDALLTLIRMPALDDWRTMFDELAASGRASTTERSSSVFWVATERLSLVDDANAIVGGWMESLGPVTIPELAAKLALPPDEIESALLQLESRGQVLRGHFRNTAGEFEWCNRRILARIHRATLGRLRREIEPVTALDFERFLQTWQHVSPNTQLHGADGTLHVIRQLQGYEIPASAWESEILARRIVKYSPDFLDALCFSGEVMWARISPHPAVIENRRVRPTRIAPVTIFLREDADWLMPENGPAGISALSHPAQDVLTALERHGASFFAELVRHTKRLASEVEDGLWELLAGGFVTADGFDNLRALIDPKRRRGEGRDQKKRPRNAAGRWALLSPAKSTLNPEERVQRFAHQLLLRWGVLLRDLLAREVLAPAWRDLLPVLRRMEARGEIRGGRFVGGFTGEQFARPEALDLLRSIRRNANGAAAPETLSNADPLNLTGIILPGPRVSRLAVMGIASA